MGSGLGACSTTRYNHLKKQGSNFTSLVALVFPPEYDVMCCYLGICISGPPALCFAHSTGLGPQFVFNVPVPQFVFTDSSPKFVFTGPSQSGAGLAYTNIAPLICIYWPWPTIFITVLWICIYRLIFSSSSDSNNISNSSNFLGLDNINISMPILVN